MDVTKEVYTTDEAAAFLGVAKRTIEEEIRKGGLQAYKRFSRWYIFHTDLIQYIKAGNQSKVT